ncbi:MAG: alpha-amylase family glycosyl hydrolase [Chloroflexota bacterium]
MHDLNDLAAAASSSSAKDIAGAPGDLPMPDVLARFNALQWQFRHDNTIDPLAPLPEQPVQIFATTGSGMHVTRAVVYYTLDGTDPDTGSAQAPMEIDDVVWDARAGFLTQWRAVVPGQPEGTVVRYRLGGWRSGITDQNNNLPYVWAHDGQGFWFRFPGTKGITTFAYVVEDPRPALPDWMANAVIYHIFLDRFHPGTHGGAFRAGTGAHERHGGTLAGVRQSLPYLTELGVTCLWFSPLGPSETYHRYDTQDYFDIDPEIGTAVELRDLVAEAHRLGMRVWLDFVPSHSSWHHPAFQAAQLDRHAPTFGWFTFDEWPHEYRNFMGSSRYLPSLNTDDPGARAHLIDAARFWLRQFDVDGFRLDHAIGPGMDFWVALRTATETLKPDVALVGEVTDTPDCLRRYRGKLHGVLDFPLARALRLCFGAGSWNVSDLDHFLSAYERYMAAGPGRVSFLDNHDMDRFLWVAGNDTRRLKIAAICQFSLGATPVVYYGTEIGMTQESGAAESGFGGDAEARRDMPWDEARWDRDLLSFYQALIRLRRDEPAVYTGTRKTIHLDGENGTYAFARAVAYGDPGTPSTVTILNVSEQEREVRIPVQVGPDHVSCLLTSGHAPQITQKSDGVFVALAPMTAAILRL